MTMMTRDRAHAARCHLVYVCRRGAPLPATMLRSLCLCLLLVTSSYAFVPHGQSVARRPQGQHTVVRQRVVCQGWFDNKETKMPEPVVEEPKKKGFIGGFFEELDNFVDDAMSRKLGNVSSRSTSMCKKSVRERRIPADSPLFRSVRPASRDRAPHSTGSVSPASMGRMTR